VSPTVPFKTRALHHAHRHFIHMPSLVERSVSLLKLFSPFLKQDTTHMAYTEIPGFS